MKALNSLVFVSVSSLAIASAAADEPVKAQPQQAVSPQNQGVITGRPHRRLLVNPQQSVIVQAPSSTQQSAAVPANNAPPNNPAKIATVPQQPVIEAQRRGLLGRLFGGRKSSVSYVPAPPQAGGVQDAKPLPLGK